MLRKWMLVAVVACATAGVAWADEAPAVAESPVSDELRPEPGDNPEAHHDASQWFNFWGGPGEHYGKDVLGGPLGDGVMTDPKTGEVIHEEEPMSAPFIFMVLNFALLLGVLAWKGGPAISKLAADRHDQIKTALDEAAALRAQAQGKLDELKSKLDQADAEITKMVEGMRADAEADQQRILENAERQAAQMKHDAEQRIAAEIEAARAALAREVAAAATAAAEQLLRDKMTAADQTQVISTFITDVQSVAARRAEGGRS